MLTQVRINRPAWPGIRPANNEFTRHVPKNIRRWIERILRSKFLEGDIMVLECAALSECSSDRPFGHYYIKARSSDKGIGLYVRVAKPWTSAEREILASVSSHLSIGGCNVQEWLNSKRNEGPFLIDNSSFAESVQISVSPFRELEQLYPSADALRKAGNALGKFHKCLKSFKDAGTVAVATSERTKKLEKVKRVFSGEEKTGISAVNEAVKGFSKKHPGFISRLVKDYTPDFRILHGPESQPIHGDINAGNIYREAGGGIVILDLEETRHSYFPVLVDIAFFVQRFICFDAPDIALLGSRMESFFDGYSGLDSTRWYSENGKIAEQLACMMRQICYYSMCVLVYAYEEDEGYPFASESEKFACLEQQAVEYLPVFRKLDKQVFHE